MILIGDAPAKNPDQIQNYRNSYGGESLWASSRFKQPTHFKPEAMKLKESGVPIHTFHIGSGCRPNFLEIANMTSGKCQELDINSS